MIAYEIQLRYVIRDKIQSETKSEILFFFEMFLWQKKNFIGKTNFLWKFFFYWKKNCWEKNSLKKNLLGKRFLGFFSQTEFCLGCCLGFPVRILSCLGQIDAYHH